MVNPPQPPQGRASTLKNVYQNTYIYTNKSTPMAIIVDNQDIVFYPIQESEFYYIGNITGVLEPGRTVFSRVDIDYYFYSINKEVVEYDSVVDYLEKNQVSFAALEPEVTLILKVVNNGPKKIWIENDHGDRLTINYYSLCTLYNSVTYKDLKEKQQELFNQIKLQ